MTDTSSRPLRVFLCHSSGDKPIMRELYQKLSSEGWLDVWLDEAKLLPGQDWNYEIEKALDNSDAVIVTLSTGSVSKEGYVQRELRLVLEMALEKPEGTIFILPVRLDNCERPRRLRSIHGVDYFPENLRGWAFERIIESLKARANRLGVNIEAPLPEEMTEETKPDSATHVLKQVATPPNKLILSNGMEMMRVPAGKFLMGSNADNKLAHRDEMPQHTVDIPYDYWMARFPITNELYSVYVESKRVKHPVDGWEKKRNHPVYSISWEDSMEYCHWLNDLFNSELPSGLLLRLPTEAEWEKAARGTDGREYPWGNEFDNTQFNSSRVYPWDFDTTPVGSCSPRGDSPYGCADMLGNVWEWTHSWYWYSYPYKVDDGREIELTWGARVCRGGSCFFNIGGHARCAYRNIIFNRILGFHFGVRVVAAPKVPI